MSEDTKTTTDSPPLQPTENALVSADSGSEAAQDELEDSTISGAELLDQITEAIAKHSVLLPGRAQAIALWAVHAHAYKAADHSPFLALLSPEKRCGKTTSLIVLSHLVPDPLLTSNISAAALYKAVNGSSCTLLLDEADRLLRGATFIGMIQSAHDRLGGTVGRLDRQGQPTQYSVYGPKAFGLIGTMEDTMADRSIIIEMRRKRRDENVDRIRPELLAVLARLKRLAAKFAADRHVELAAADPKIPASLYDRAEQNWRPLLAIADVAGGHWPKTARRIAVEMIGAAEDELSQGPLILMDIRKHFAEAKAERLYTWEITNRLCQMEERPWAKWSSDKQRRATTLATLLRPFGIKPKPIRHGSQVLRGYEWSQFEDPCERYLPPLSKEEAILIPDDLAASIKRVKFQTPS